MKEKKKTFRSSGTCRTGADSANVSQWHWKDEGKMKTFRRRKMFLWNK